MELFYMPRSNVTHWGFSVITALPRVQYYSPIAKTSPFYRRICRDPKKGKNASSAPKNVRS